MRDLLSDCKKEREVIDVDWFWNWFYCLIINKKEIGIKYLFYFEVVWIWSFIGISTTFIHSLLIPTDLIALNRPDIRSLDRNLAPPLFFRHLNLLNLFLQGHTFSLIQEHNVAEADNGKKDEDGHGVDVVSLEVAQVDRAGGWG